MRHWKITVKKVTEPLPVVTEVNADSLDEVRQDFGLEEKDVEWFTIEEVKS